MNGVSTVGHSLGGRLSAWLAIQTLVALAALSAAVYAVNAWSLNKRQWDELAPKRDAVLQVLSDPASPTSIDELKHRLDELLVGHADIALRMVDDRGQALYASRPLHASHEVRAVSVDVAWPAGAASSVTATLSLDVSGDRALLNQLAVTLGVASLLGSAVVTGTGYLLVRRALAPVRELSRQVDALSVEHVGLRLDGSRQPAELQPLVDRFNTLLARVERAYLQLEGFNADVAHELRTPLTTLIGASEVALRRERPSQELEEVIAANLDDLRRLAGIVNDMLFLSRADHGAKARREPVESLAAAFTDVVDYHEAALSEKQQATLIEGDCRGEFDLSLLRRALSNLLSNAGRYAGADSTIAVSIESRGERVRLAVRNHGTAIPPEHLPRLFDRFYRVEPSRQQGGSNHGLGLAIVAAIARMHGGEPFAASADGVTTVGLDLPLR